MRHYFYLPHLAIATHISGAAMSHHHATPRCDEASHPSIEWLTKSRKHHFRAFQTQRQHTDFVIQVVLSDKPQNVRESANSPVVFAGSAP
jgi:hypothetical protein